MIPYYNGLFMFYPFLQSNCSKPPTLYSVLNSIVNGDKDEDDYTKIIDLAKEGRNTIFNFNYPLTEHITKEEFEVMILNHYMQRRIGFETVTAFRLQLSVKLNEIMPIYNKMFDLLYDTKYFGNITKREGFDNRTTENINNTENELNNKSTTKDTSDRRNSELPQNQLEDLRNGSYVTDYNYDQNNSEDESKSIGTSKNTNNGTDNNVYEETITNINELDVFLKINQEIKNIYSLIFKDLDCLFYQIL